MFLAFRGKAVRSNGRKVGKEAATMMRAFSAPAQRRSSPTSYVGSVLALFALRNVHFTIAVAPALTILGHRSVKGEAGQTYKIPRLIAMATPAFSFLFILRRHIIAHGTSARTKSVAAEYALMD